MSEVDQALRELQEAEQRYDRALERSRVKNRLSEKHTAVIIKAGDLIRGFLDKHGEDMSNRDLYELVEALDEERDSIVQFQKRFQKPRPV